MPSARTKRLLVSQGLAWFFIFLPPSVRVTHPPPSFPPHKGEGGDGTACRGTFAYSPAERASLPLVGRERGWGLVWHMTTDHPHPSRRRPGGQRGAAASGGDSFVGDDVLFAELVDQRIVIGLDDVFDAGAVEQV